MVQLFWVNFIQTSWRETGKKTYSISFHPYKEQNCEHRNDNVYRALFSLAIIWCTLTNSGRSWVQQILEHRKLTKFYDMMRLNFSELVMSFAAIPGGWAISNCQTKSNYEYSPFVCKKKKARLSTKTFLKTLRKPALNARKYQRRKPFYHIFVENFLRPNWVKSQDVKIFARFSLSNIIEVATLIRVHNPRRNFYNMVLLKRSVHLWDCGKLVLDCKNKFEFSCLFQKFCFVSWKLVKPSKDKLNLER